MRWSQKRYRKEDPGTNLPLDRPIDGVTQFYHELLVNEVALGDPTIDVTGASRVIYVHY